MSMETPSRLSVVAWSRRAEVVEGGRDLDADVGAAEADAVLGGGGEQAQADGRPEWRPIPVQPTSRLSVRR